MKIEAYNLEDFENQFRKQVDTTSLPYEIDIELKTDDNFWNVLIAQEAKKQLIELSYGVDIDDVVIKQAYHHKFGNIKRV